jgi:hypothetical protein
MTNKICFLALLASGCAVDGYGEAWPVASTTQELALLSIDRLGFEVSACVVSESNYTPTELTRVVDIISQWEMASGVEITWGSCAPVEADGDYPGDIRLLLGSARAIGTPIGCTQVEAPNFGTYPKDQDDWRKCKWNMRMPVGQAENNILHESGHMLGFVHEHDRDDQDGVGAAECPGGDFFSDPENPFLTGYDINSVMHYNYDPGSGDDTWEDCPAPGNWGSTGLSPSDRLGVEMVYPKSYTRRIFGYQFAGQPVLRTEEPELKLDWTERGARDSALEVWWNVDGSLISAPVAALDSEPAQYAVSAYMWDLFGDVHVVDEVAVHVDNSKHTALVLSTL